MSTIEELKKDIAKLQEKLSELEKKESKHQKVEKIIDEELKSTEFLLNETGQMAKVGGWEINVSQNTLKWTAETFNIHELSPEKQPSISDAIEFYHPDDREMVSSLVEKAMKNGLPFYFEARLITAKSNLIHVRANCKTFSKNGKIVGIRGSFQDITEQKNTQAELQLAIAKTEESEEKYRLLHENAGIGIGYYSPEGIVLSYNSIASKDMGGVPDDFVGKTLYELFPQDAAKEYDRRLQKAIKSDFAEVYEDKVDLPNRTKWFISTYTKIKNSQQKLIGIQIISQDITSIKESELELKKAKEDAEKSDEKFKAFSEQSSVSIYVTDQKGDCIYVNDRWKKMAGMTDEEAYGKGWIKAIHPDDRAEISNKWYKSVNSNGKWTFEYRFLDKKNNVTWVEGTAKPMYNKNNEQVGFLGSNVDITERKKIGDELKRNEILLRSSIESPLDMIILSLDKEYRYLYFNKAHENDMLAAYGKAPQLGQCIFDYMTNKQDIQSIKNVYDLGLNGESNTSINIYGDLEKKYYEVRINPIIDDSKEIIGITSFSHDITEKKEIEKALTESEERFRLMFSRHHAVMILIEPESGKIIDANIAAEKFYGYSKTDLCKLKIQDINLLSPNEVELERGKAFLGEKNYFEFDHKLANGDICPVEVFSSPITIDGQKLLFSIIIDIREKRKAKQELILAREKAEKNEANVTAIIEGTQNSIWAFDRDYKILYINQVMQDEFLHTFGVLLKPGMSLIEALPKPFQPLWKPRYDRVLANEQFTIEDAVPTENGTVYIEVSFNPIISDGKAIGGSCFGSNITSRKNAEKELRNAKLQAEESQANITAIIEGSNNSIWAFDKNYKILYINKLFQSEFHKTFGVLLKPGMSIMEAHPDSLTHIWKPRYDRVLSNEQFKIEDTIPTDAGNIYIEISFYPIVKDGEVIGGSCIGNNITSRKLDELELIKAKEKAEKSEMRLMEAQELSHLGSWEYIIDSDVVSWSKELRNIFELTEDAEVPKYTKQQSYYTKESFDKLDKAVQDCIQKGIPYEIELDIITSSGSIKTIISKGDVIKDHNKKVIGLYGTALDITVKKKVEKELILAKEKAEDLLGRLEAALESMSDAVFISDAKGNFVNFNHAFVSFHKFKNLEDCARTLEEYPIFLDVYKPDGEFLTTENWVVNKALRGESGLNEEYHLKRKDTGESWIGSYNYAPIKNNKGEIIGSVTTARDITDVKMAEKELIIAKEKAESANIHKNYFLANMSHEIRTPMNGVLGFTNLLLEEDFSKKEREKYLHIIERNSLQLLTLIDDIIDISKIESNDLKVVTDKCKVADILYDLEENFNQIKYKLNKENIMLKLEIPANYEDLSIITDAHRLRQVLSNLMNNAFKFSEQATITFGFKMKKSVIEFYVRDQGIGIPPEKLDEIFERFKQLNYKNAAKYGGTGLGLAISKGIINLLGGQISVKSKPNRGSTFSFTLPIDE